MKKKLVLGVICVAVLCIIIILGLKGCEKNKEEVLQTNKRDNTVMQIEIVNDYINIREEKSVSSDILGKVYKGEIYTVISEDDKSTYHWFEVETSTGIKGFISGQDSYVKLLEFNSESSKIETTTKMNDTTQTTTTKKSDNNKKSTTTTKSNSSVTTTTVITSKVTSSTSTTSKPQNSSNETTKVSKKTVSATKTAYCQNGQEQYKNGRISYCLVKTWDESKVVVGCPSGYTLNESIDKCETGEDRPSVKPVNQPYCSDGSQVVYESISGTFSCRTGTLITQRCPDGYYWNSTNINGISISSCVWKNYYKTTNKETSCTEGKYYSYKNSCLITSRENVSYKYTCPDGYTLNDTLCYEN